MTIDNAIGSIDRLVFNQIDRDVKIDWLSHLDGIIDLEIHSGSETLKDIEFQGYDKDTDPDKELLCVWPYDEVYLYYLEMKVHDVNGEIVKYNNAAEKFNTALVRYMDYVNRTYRPVGKGKLTLI